MEFKNVYEWITCLVNKQTEMKKNRHTHGPIMPIVPERVLKDENISEVSFWDPTQNISSLCPLLKLLLSGIQKDPVLATFIVIVVINNESIMKSLNT